jgi:hypothetical protein
VNADSVRDVRGGNFDHGQDTLPWPGTPPFQRATSGRLLVSASPALHSGRARRHVPGVSGDEMYMVGGRILVFRGNRCGCSFPEKNLAGYRRITVVGKAKEPGGGFT